MRTFRRGATHYYGFRYAGKRYRRGGFPTKRLAELAGQTHLRRLTNERIVRVWGVRETKEETPTLKEYVEKIYRPHVLPALATATQQSRRSVLKRLIKELGSYPLSGLTAPILDAWTARRRESIMASTIAEEASVLSHICWHAVNRGVIDRHPWKGKWKIRRQHRPRFYILSAQEEMVLLQATTPDWYRLLVSLVLQTGLRVGEVVSLERRWFDWDRSELRVPQGKTGIVKTIPLKPNLCDTIRHYFGQRVSRWVFTQHNGQPYSTASIRKRWRRVCRITGITGCRFHDLRHTFATRLAQQTTDPSVVGSILGHKPPYLQTNIYLHPLDEAKRAAIAKLGGPKSGPVSPTPIRRVPPK